MRRYCASICGKQLTNDGRGPDIIAFQQVENVAIRDMILYARQLRKNNIPDLR